MQLLLAAIVPVRPIRIRSFQPSGLPYTLFPRAMTMHPSMPATPPLPPIPGRNHLNPGPVLNAGSLTGRIKSDPCIRNLELRKNECVVKQIDYRSQSCIRVNARAKPVLPQSSQSEQKPNKKAPAPNLLCAHRTPRLAIIGSLPLPGPDNYRPQRYRNPLSPPWSPFMSF